MWLWTPLAASRDLAWEGVWEEDGGTIRPTAKESGSQLLSVCALLHVQGFLSRAVQRQDKQHHSLANQCTGGGREGAHVWNPLSSLPCPSLGAVTGDVDQLAALFPAPSSQARERISVRHLAGARVLRAGLVATGGAGQRGRAATEPLQGLVCGSDR